jgi:hypothetical protein
MWFGRLTIWSRDGLATVRPIAVSPLPVPCEPSHFVACRCGAQWNPIDLVNAEWRTPAESLPGYGIRDYSAQPFAFGCGRQSGPPLALWLTTRRTPASHVQPQVSRSSRRPLWLATRRAVAAYSQPQLRSVGFSRRACERLDSLLASGRSLPIERRAPPALVAQRIEHLTTDQKVGGSNPSERAIGNHRLTWENAPGEQCAGRASDPLFGLKNGLKNAIWVSGSVW